MNAGYILAGVSLANISVISFALGFSAASQHLVKRIYPAHRGWGPITSNSPEYKSLSLSRKISCLAAVVLLGAFVGAAWGAAYSFGMIAISEKGFFLATNTATILGAIMGALGGAANDPNPWRLCSFLGGILNLQGNA